jgi:hypothetical protein
MKPWSCYRICISAPSAFRLSSVCNNMFPFIGSNVRVHHRLFPFSKGVSNTVVDSPFPQRQLYNTNPKEARAPRPFNSYRQITESQNHPSVLQLRSTSVFLPSSFFPHPIFFGPRTSFTQSLFLSLFYLISTDSHFGRLHAIAR